MSHKTKFELWWREINEFSWTIESFIDASEYQRRKQELKRNFEDALFPSIEILPVKTRSLT
jgi:hypothetical protein